MASSPDSEQQFDNTLPLMSGSDFAESLPLSLDYAASVLADQFGIDVDESHPLVAAMAAEMSDAWFSAAEDWLRRHRSFLAAVPTEPRECWCGQWPDLGTGCHYHGRCTCLERGRGLIGYTRVDEWMLRSPGRIYGIEPNHRITLPGDCSVHPGTEVPGEHAERLYERLDAAKYRDAQPSGRPPTPASMLEAER